MANMRLVLSGLMVLSVLGCGDRNFRKNIDPKPEHAAPKSVSDSFGFENNAVFIEKNSLEKEFLLQAVLSPQVGAPQFSSTKSRVVSFRLKNNKIYMLETTQGHSSSNSLPQNLLLAEFPILKEKGDFISFDFNAGMSQIFVTEDWAAHDGEEIKYESKNVFKSVPVIMSYLEDVKILNTNQFMIRQIAQINNEGSPQPVEVKYYLSPYHPNPAFVPTESRDYDRFGFFEVNPLIEDSDKAFTYATKWDIEKPVTYAVSHNTPSEFRQAIRDGVLYWNKAFGREVLKVVDAPREVKAPDINYNLIQWMDWSSARFAYADGQFDPRSGETLHAQIFLPSGIAGIGKGAMRQILRRWQQGQDAPVPRAKIGLKNFASSHLCDYEGQKAFVESYEKLLNLDLNEKEIMEINLDFLRLIVAHEVGHTLGLRHNFAGNLGANYLIEKRDEVFMSYVKTQTAPEGIVPSTSVMDYLALEEDMIAGDMVAQPKKILKYDQQVIEKLYFNKTPAMADRTLFCTDGHVGLYQDCQRNDAGIGPLEFAKFRVGRLLEIFPYTFMENFVTAKTPFGNHDPVDVENVDIGKSKNVALGLLEPRREAFAIFTEARHLISIERLFPANSDFYRNEIRSKELEFVTSETSRVGGLSEIFKVIDPGFAKKTVVAVEKVMSGGVYDKGTSINGKSFNFSQADYAKIKGMSKDYLAKLQQDLVRADIDILAQKQNSEEKTKEAPKAVPQLADTDMSFEVAELFASRVRAYAFSDSEHYINGTVGVVTGEGPTKTTKQVEVRLPVPSYPFDIRVSVTGLLNPARSANPIWGVKQRNSLAKELAEKINGLLKVEKNEQASLETSSVEVQRWVTEQTLVLKALVGGK